MTRPKTSACSSTENRLSKSTFLAMLQTKSVVGIKVGDTVSYTKSSGRTDEYLVDSVGNTLATISNDSETLSVNKNLLKTAGKDSLFDKLEDDEWSIISFNPHSRVVCVEIANGTVTQTISVVLPALV